MAACSREGSWELCFPILLLSGWKKQSAHLAGAGVHYCIVPSQDVSSSVCSNWNAAQYHPCCWCCCFPVRQSCGRAPWLLSGREHLQLTRGRTDKDPEAAHRDEPLSAEIWQIWILWKPAEDNEIRSCWLRVVISNDLMLPGGVSALWCFIIWCLKASFKSPSNMY